MYAVTVRPEFIARGWLTVTGPRPGAECHSHQLRAELTAEGPPPDEYGYPVDINHVNEAPNELENRDRDATLDELPELEVQMREDVTAATACAAER